MTATAQNQQKQTDVHGIVTQHIVNSMETGVMPWRAEWKTHGIPTNLITKKPYRGINVLLLAMMYFESNYFISEEQMKNLAIRPRKGQHYCLATYWQVVDGKESVEKKTALRYEKVYNVSQCEGDDLPIPQLREPQIEDPMDVCKRIVRSMQAAPSILPGEAKAPNYDIANDTVTLASAKDYKSGPGYYYDLFRMLVHATGHESRLNRKELYNLHAFSHSYSHEALIADIGAHYLCFYSGINRVPLADTIYSLHGWIETLVEDKRLIVFAATQAQKAIDCILKAKEAVRSETTIQE